MSNYSCTNCGYCVHKHDTATNFAACKSCTNQSSFEAEHACDTCIFSYLETDGAVTACNICRRCNHDETMPDNWEEAA